MDADNEEKKELVPRNYQEKLIRIAVKENSIIYLPTGSGKTFIAVCVLKELAKDAYQKTYSNGGKISLVLVNTVTLVQQHSKYLKNNTPYEIGFYSGDMNVDFWDIHKWIEEFDKNQVLVMTAQICINMINSQFIDLNKVNLIIFDECHQGVESHAMRQTMMSFQGVTDKPRVLGLTATLLNGNVKSNLVLDEVKTLETTFHGKVATVDELEHVIGFSTNPQELVIVYESPTITSLQDKICLLLDHYLEILRHLKPPKLKVKRMNLPFLDKDRGYIKLIKILLDAQAHVKTLGIAGSQIATICYIIHLECEKKQCTDKTTMLVINAIITMFTLIKDMIDEEMRDTNANCRLLKFSSPKIIKLIEILKSYVENSQEELCGIVFVQRKNTALFLYHILQQLIKTYDNMSHIKPDFIIGFNANPLSSTREALYNAKVNKKIVSKFISKEINLLIASNVIEEGLDVPKCTLVIKFDTPTNYREYIQSKGRARHQSSLYYVMVDRRDSMQFYKNYGSYKNTEESLNQYLIGRNDARGCPQEDDINLMYLKVPPYYVNGPNSAKITMLSATQLLMMYCMSFPTDSYTTYEPNWYLEQIFGADDSETSYRVHVELPLVSPIKRPVSGKKFPSKKEAKRSAAFITCILLHKMGELNDNLVPIKQKISEKNLEYLFKHHPAVKEKDAGATKKRRVYPKKVPKVISSPITVSDKVYLHIINIQTEFSQSTNIDYMMQKLYNDDLTFGFITSCALQELCKFPVYVSAGEMSVTVETNVASISLSANELVEIRSFHYLIFKDVLKILKPFLIMGSSDEVKNMLLVPVQKHKKLIDFDIMAKHKDIIDDTIAPSIDYRMKIIANDENYLGRIVTPYYRQENKQYVVLEVCQHLNAESQFPKEGYKTYAQYFHEKYTVSTYNPKQALLLVKPITSKLNFLKPRGVGQKRRREESFEEMNLHLIPEMCVKQEFPSCLWLQAKLLPTILHRIGFLLRAEELRATISLEKQLGAVTGSAWEPLSLDMHLLNYKTEFPNLKNKISKEEPIEMDINTIMQSLRQGSLNKEYTEKIKDMEYPWTAEQEPKDINRNLNATILDIQYYVKFVKEPVNKSLPNFPQTSSQLALDYDRSFAHRPIKLLESKVSTRGPELSSIYQTLMTAKANDIVNMERLETLGDSYLKLLASLYVFLKFPDYTEGQATELKSRLISNKNLFYLANQKGLHGMLKIADFNAELEWLPPGFCVPPMAKDLINKKEMPVSNLFYIDVPEEEKISGVVSHETNEFIKSGCSPDNEDDDENSFSSMCNYLGQQMVPDKTIADVAEALIGIYFYNQGFEGGLRFIEWLGIIPESENLSDLMKKPVSSPLISPKVKEDELEFLMPKWYAAKVESILGYKFKNRAFLLQALTHSSYSTNRITHSYQRLEFIGDAVLDFLITTYIYESCGNLTPGELTDLRSALVNNETFAAYTVKLQLYKYLKYFNSVLQYHIMKFVVYQKHKNFSINNDVLILLNEKDLKIAENVDVPKVLGDIFESIAGAIYLDSDMDLKTVWRVFYKIMWEEIDLFSKDVPKNPIRMLTEKLAPLYPTFHKTVEISSGTVMVKLDFMLSGSLTRVHGFGDNKKTARKAASKIALRLLMAKTS